MHAMNNGTAYFATAVQIEISLECARSQKMFPHLKLIYFIIFCLWAPLLVLTQSKETVS
jgi:hypothetical protein